MLVIEIIFSDFLSSVALGCVSKQLDIEELCTMVCLKAVWRGYLNFKLLLQGSGTPPSSFYAHL